MEEYNPKIVLIVLSHYFCNLEHLTDDSLILSYYFKLLDYVNADSEIDWDEIGNDYIIWQPFEHVNPCDVIDNMNNLYHNIKHILNLSAPNIVINPLEVASELSHEKVVDYFTTDLKENFEYTTDNGTTHYVEDAQEMFNQNYSQILDKILGLKL